VKYVFNFRSFTVSFYFEKLNELIRHLTKLLDEEYIVVFELLHIINAESQSVENEQKVDEIASRLESLILIIIWFLMKSRVNFNGFISVKYLNCH